MDRKKSKISEHVIAKLDIPGTMLHRQYQNLIDDFLIFMEPKAEKFGQEEFDNLFIAFSMGVNVAISPGSNFNRKYKLK